jgi:hypothetical protein
MRIFLLASAFILFSVNAAEAHSYHTAGPKNNSFALAEKKDSVSTENAYSKLLKDGGSECKGMFTVRHIKKDWYFEVPDSLIGRLILAVTRLQAVPEGFKMQGGEEVNRSVIYWEQYDSNTLLLREYVKSQFADEKNNLSEALKQATIDPIISKFDVIGKNPTTGNQLINVTKFLTEDNKTYGFTSKDRSILGIGSLASDKTFLDSIKTYPINVEAQSTRTYSISSGKFPAVQTGYVTVKLNTSMVLLPKSPMQPRLADSRVGFFQNSLTEFSDEQQKTQNEAIVQRYKLVPKDLNRYLKGKLSEPENPIVYYIDPATPKKWIPYLKAGIEDWNIAFEAAGFKNAIIAKDWPNDPDMSLDDARFCVLRYLPSENENAYGPRIVDPRSGQIIESHICWYHNVMNLLKKWYMIQCGPLDKRAQSMTFDDKLMGELIRFVSSHEVGHTLGLRHNMAASAATPVEKLRDKKWVEANGHTVSIMDYARFNYVAQPEDNISEKGLFPRIGDYDKWAIKWGYQYRPEFADTYAEKNALRKEVTKKLKEDPRMLFIGDEGKGIDARSQKEDLGDNNMKANEYGIKNLKRVMLNIKKWTAQPDGEYDDLKSMYEAIRMQYLKYLLHVQKNVGGYYTNNTPDEKPFEYAPRNKQKEAISWMDRNLFDAQLWLYPNDIVQYTDLKAVDEIQNQQSSAIALLLAPGMLVSQHKAALLSSDPYPIDEYLNDVFDAVWHPLNDKNELMNNYRRQLERTYLSFIELLMNQNGKDNVNNLSLNRSDVMLYIEQHVGKIEAYINSQIISTNSESINRKHYDALLRHLKAVKDKYYNEKQ